jgi:hypothetical protein
MRAYHNEGIICAPYIPSSKEHGNVILTATHNPQPKTHNPQLNPHLSLKNNKFAPSLLIVNCCLGYSAIFLFRVFRNQFETSGLHAIPKSFTHFQFNDFLFGVLCPGFHGTGCPG